MGYGVQPTHPDTMHKVPHGQLEHALAQMYKQGYTKVAVSTRYMCKHGETGYCGMCVLDAQYALPRTQCPCGGSYTTAGGHHCDGS